MAENQSFFLHEKKFQTFAHLISYNPSLMGKILKNNVVSDPTFGRLARGGKIWIFLTFARLSPVWLSPFRLSPNLGLAKGESGERRKKMAKVPTDYIVCQYNSENLQNAYLTKVPQQWFPLSSHFDLFTRENVFDGKLTLNNKTPV